MAYSINKTDGTILAAVPDGQIDQLTSDITLIGKNYSGFGEALNENFVKMLENFANSSRPERPVRGQIWFDSAESKLKVYTGTAFVPVSSATISRTQPVTLGVGDLWFNDVDRQLYFFDGITPILLGPSFSTSQGSSGLEVQTVLDLNNISRVITLLRTGGTLLGIFSKDQFIPKLAIQGFNDLGEEKLIFPGFNAGTLAGLKFNVTAANAEKLGNTLASNFARKDQANIFDFQMIVRTNDGISFGSAAQGLLDTEVGNVRFINTVPNRNVEINVRRGTDQEKAIVISSADQQVKIYENQPNSTTSIGGSLIVDGNLTISGTTTTINTEVITLEDKNLELAKIPVPTDAYASGGGIIIKGNSSTINNLSRTKPDHEWIWIHNDAASGQANESWNTEENINISPGKAYKIDGVDILTAAACFVPSFPNVNQLGVQINLTVDDVFVDDNQISTLNNRDLELAPSGTGNILVVGGKKIKGIITTNEAFPSLTLESDTLLTNDELSEAVSKRYALNLARRRPIVLSLDITDAPSNAAIALLVAQIAPPSEYENGTIARVMCSAQANSTTTLNINPLLNKTNNVSYRTTDEFDQSIGSGFPLQDISVNPATVPAQAISVFRVVKTFELLAGAWSFVQ